MDTGCEIQFSFSGATETYWICRTLCDMHVDLCDVLMRFFKFSTLPMTGRSLIPVKVVDWWALENFLQNGYLIHLYINHISNVWHWRLAFQIQFYSAIYCFGSNKITSDIMKELAPLNGMGNRILLERQRGRFNAEYIKDLLQIEFMPFLWAENNLDPLGVDVLYHNKWRSFPDACHNLLYTRFLRINEECQILMYNKMLVTSSSLVKWILA